MHLLLRTHLDHVELHGRGDLNDVLLLSMKAVGPVIRRRHCFLGDGVASLMPVDVDTPLNIDVATEMGNCELNLTLHWTSKRTERLLK